MTRTDPATFVRLPRAVSRPRRAPRTGAIPLPRTSPIERSIWLDPLLLGILATLVSSIGSWIPSKWNDEAATQTAASRTWPQLWRMMHSIDAVHGFYYALMHAWVEVFGTTAFALRAPSMLAVGIACGGVVVLGRRLGTRRLAVCAGVVFAVLPRVTWMGMEARSSAMTAAVAVWLTIALLHAVRVRRTSWWILYVAIAGAGVALNIYLAILLFAHGITLVILRRRLERPWGLIARWGASATVGVILASPILALALTQTGQLPFSRPTFWTVLNTLGIQQYFVGATPTYVRAVPFPPTYLWSWAALVLAVIGWALILLPVVWRRIRPVPANGNSIGLVALAVPWIVVPLVLLVGYSLVATPIYTARYFCFTTPAVALLAGASISALVPQWRRIAVIGVLAIVALPIYLSQRTPTSKNATDWGIAATIIQDHAKAGEDIYYGPSTPKGQVTMGKLRDAYPLMLENLTDITLRSTGAEDGTLWSANWPLTHARATLRTTPMLWAVIEHYGTTSPRSTKQERYIRAQGLHLVRIWRGLSTDVLEFAR